MQAESIHFSPKSPKICHIQHSWQAVDLKHSFFAEISENLNTQGRPIEKKSQVITPTTTPESGVGVDFRICIG